VLWDPSASGGKKSLSKSPIRSKPDETLSFKLTNTYRYPETDPGLNGGYESGTEAPIPTLKVSKKYGYLAGYAKASSSSASKPMQATLASQETPEAYQADAGEANYPETDTSPRPRATNVNEFVLRDDGDFLPT
jgi:hypothetical protein